MHKRKQDIYTKNKRYINTNVYSNSLWGVRLKVRGIWFFKLKKKNCNGVNSNVFLLAESGFLYFLNLF